MPRKTFEGSGTLPGMEPEPAPAPRPRLNAQPGATGPARYWAAAGLGVLAFLLAALYGFHKLEQFLVSDPRFTLYGAAYGSPGNGQPATLEIAGAMHVSSRAVLALFSQDLGRSVYLTPLEERRNALRAVDWIKDASVARLWPNRLLVRLRERVPVAFLAQAPGRHGSSNFALIDEDGVVLPPASDHFAVPVLTGVHASDPVQDRRERVHGMLRLTGELGAEASAKISEIDVSDPDNLKITQAYGGKLITLQLGDHNFSVRYQNFVNHFEEIERRLPGARTLDLRLEDRITVVE